MADPVTASLGLIAASGAFSAFSSIQQGKQAEQIAEQEAKFQEDKAALEESQFRRQALIQAGTRRAIASKAGRDPGTGTALNLLAEQAGQDELDALIIRFGGESAAQRERFKGKVAKSQSQQKAFGTLLSTGASLAGGFGASGGSTGVNNTFSKVSANRKMTGAFHVPGSGRTMGL